MKLFLFFLTGLFCLLNAQTIEWKMGDETLAQATEADEKVEFDKLTPYAKALGGQEPTLYVGLYVIASIEDGQLAGTAYYINLQGFLGFGLDKDAQKLAPIVPVERVEFCFPATAGKWYPIVFKTKNAPKDCAIRIAPPAPAAK